MYRILLLCTGLLCSLSSINVNAEKRGYHFLNGRQFEEVSIKIINNLPVLEVTVNEGRKLNFILDTGMRTTLIFSKAFLRGLDYHMGKEIKFAGLGNQHLIKGKIVADVKINIGKHVEGNHISVVVVHDNNKLKHAFSPYNIQGIIGYELFVRFMVEIDYHNRIASFLEHEYFDFNDVYKMVPLEIKDTKPYLRADLLIGDASWQEAMLMVDTGSGTTLLLRNCDKLPQIKVEAVAKGLSGTIQGLEARMDKISFKGFEMEDIPIYVVDDTKFTMVGKEYDRIGTIGGGFFAAYAVAFDYSNQKMYFRRTHPSNKRVIVNL